MYCESQSPTLSANRYARYALTKREAKATTCSIRPFWIPLTIAGTIRIRITMSSVFIVCNWRLNSLYLRFKNSEK